MTEASVSQEVVDSRCQVLNECPAFSGIKPGDILAIASCPEVYSVHYPLKKNVFRIGQESTLWFVVENGLVEGVLRDPQTFNRISQVFRRGQFLAEQVLVHQNRPYYFTATVISPEGADLLVIPPKPLFRQFNQEGRLGLHMLTEYYQIEAQKSAAMKDMKGFLHEYGHIPEPRERMFEMLLAAIEEAGMKIEREVDGKELIALHLRPAVDK